MKTKDLFYYGGLAVLLICLLSCGINNYSSSGPRKPLINQYKQLYEGKLEDDSKLIEVSIYYSVERMPEGHYVYKQYNASSRQQTHFTTYADIQRTKKHGKAMEWYDDGSKVSEGHYQNGKKSGEWRLYSSKTGNVSSYGRYKQNERVGTWTVLDTLGQVYQEKTYSNSGKDCTVIYFKKGVKTRKVVYKDGKEVSSDFLIKKESEETREVLKIVEEMPYLASCSNKEGEERRKCSSKALLAHIYSNISYPPYARRHDIQGSALVRFVINKEGDVEDVKVLRGLCDEIAAECERVVRSLPKWKPGQQSGEVVNVYFSLPIKFRLR